MELLEFILILIFAILLILVILLIINNNKNKIKTKTALGCDVKSCGALDPVSNPAYNMQQIVKQSILLEEHLINKNNNIVLEPIKFKLSDIDQYLTGFRLNIQEEESFENEFEDDIINDNNSI